MKVPLYTAQARTTSGAITPQVNAQVSSRVLSANAEVMIEAGNLLFEAGKEKVKIHAQNQAIQAEKAMEIELRSIEDAAMRQDLSVIDPADVLGKMDSVYKEYTSGKKINPVTGKPYLTTSTARSYFGSSAGDVHNRYVNSFRKNSNDIFAKTAEVNLTRQVQNEVRIAADVSLSEEDRIDALDNLFSEEDIYDPTFDVARRRGLLFYATTSGYMTAEKVASLTSDAIENIVLGTVESYMADGDYDGVALAFTSGNLEKTDPVLAAAMAQLDADDRVNLEKQVIDYANKQIKFEEDLRKKDTEAKAKRLDELNIQILNADIDDESDMAQALEAFEYLRNQNYYESLNDIKAIEKRLGLSTEEETKKDDADTTIYLNDLDGANKLTMDAVKAVADKLTVAGIDKYMQRAGQESNEAVTLGKEILADRIGFNKYKDSLSPELKSYGDTYFRRARDEFNNWLVTTPEPGQPMTGGRGASFETIVAKAQEIGTRFSAPLQAEIQKAFEDQYALIIQSISLNDDILTGFEEPGAGVNRKEYLRNYLQSLPESVRKSPQAMGIMNQLYPFLGEDVQ